jgi:hypothetical protein
MNVDEEASIGVVPSGSRCDDLDFCSNEDCSEPFKMLLKIRIGHESIGVNQPGFELIDVLPRLINRASNRT